MQDLGVIIKAKILDKGLASESELRGCTEEDILILIQKQHVTRLPDSYKEFLRAIGRNASRLWLATEYTYDELIRLKDDALKLLEQNGNPIALPDDAFVFHMIEGLMFYYFHTQNEDNDPSVYIYSEIEHEHSKVNERLSDYLLNIL